MRVNPKAYNLPSRTQLEEIDSNTIAIVMNRKSRIIMTDGNKVFEKSNKIKEVRPNVDVVLKTSAPICSKTIKYLKDNGIKIIQSIN